MYLSFEILLGLILVIANSHFDVLLIYAQKTLVQYGTSFWKVDDDLGPKIVQNCLKLKFFQFIP